MRFGVGVLRFGVWGCWLRVGGLGFKLLCFVFKFGFGVRGHGFGFDLGGFWREEMEALPLRGLRKTFLR